MASQFYDRYVNNDLLAFLCRPQCPEGCSIASLATAINYLFGSDHGITTQEDVAQALGFRAEAIGIEGGPGNEIVLDWFRKYTAEMGWQASCGILLDREDAADESRDDGIFEELKEIIRGRETVLVYHLEHHYNLVCGYLEHAMKPQEAYDASSPQRRWLILADTSSERDPIWSIRWEAVREDFRRDRRHCLLAFSRTG